MNAYELVELLKDYDQCADVSMIILGPDKAGLVVGDEIVLTVFPDDPR